MLMLICTHIVPILDNECAVYYASTVESLQAEMNPGYIELFHIPIIDIRMHSYILYCKWTLVNSLIYVVNSNLLNGPETVCYREV